MTLTQTAILTKQLITISVVALVLGIVGFVGYKIWYNNYLNSLPPIEEKPDLKFGLLPKPNFPPSDVSSSNFSYSLDTVTGGLPRVGIDEGFAKIIKVYFVTQTYATLLSPDRSQALAEKFGITSPPYIISEIEYQFGNLNTNLLVNLDTGNFSYSNNATPSATSLDEDSKLVSDFKGQLSRLGVLYDDLQNGRDKVTALKAEGEDYVPVNIRSEATAVQVSLWPKSIENKSIFTEDFNFSYVTALVLGSAAELKNFKTLDFAYHPIDTSTFATYPLKATEQAFEELKAGEGVIIIEPDTPQVSITSLDLGYYLSKVYSPYLLPIYVFQGPNFVAYVSAISSDLHSQNQ